MRKITIYRLYFTRSDCFRANVRQTPTGVQVHSTGANNPRLKRYVQPDDGRLGKNAYGNHHNRAGNVCASAYIGKLADDTVAIYQVLPWNIRCWLSGNGANGNANRMGYIGFEICEDGLTDESYFRAAVMGAAVNLTAHLCLLHGITTDTVRDHRELHDMGLASNHGDILHWLRKYGLTMNDFRAEVAKAMDEGVAAEYIDAGENTEGGEADMSDMILKRGDKGVLVRNLQEALLAKGYFLPKYGADGAFGNETDSAVREFQTISGLTVDGIVGPKTWAALLENGPEDIPDDAPSVDNDALKAEARGLLKRLGAILDNLS
jgi:N-acetylmuramoyl-L-alanine amidase